MARPKTIKVSFTVSVILVNPSQQVVYWLLIKNEKNETHFLLFFISIAFKLFHFIGF